MYKHPTREEAATAMMRVNARNRFFSEARAIMDRYDLPAESYETVHASLVHKAYMEEIEPLVRQISSVMALAMPSYILVPATGALEKRDDGLTEELRALVKEWEAMILAVRAKYYEENPA